MHNIVLTRVWSFSGARKDCILLKWWESGMQFVKVVFTFLAVGGTGYALFRFSHDAPPWVKILAMLAGIATLVGTIIVLPDALDAMEKTFDRIAGYVTPSKETLRRRAEEAARDKANEEARKREAEAAVQRPIDEQRRKAEEEAARAEARQEAKRKAERTSHEATEYQSARGNLQRLRSYALSCVICEYKQAALSEISSMEASMRDEDAAYRSARGNLQRLRSYANSCYFCDNKAAALSEIAAIEAQTRRQPPNTSIHQGGVIACSDDDCTFRGGRWVRPPGSTCSTPCRN
jgi:hypothetical protein